MVHTDGETLLHPDVGRLPAADAYELLELLTRKLNSPRMRLFPGSGSRHVLVLRDPRGDVVAGSPYDAVGEAIEAHMPRGEEESWLRQWMFDGFELLAEHRINRR